MQNPETVSEICPMDGSLLFHPAAFSPPESTRLFDALRHDLVWDQPTITVYGRKVPIPRVQSWKGDEGITYTYSGVTMTADGWPSVLPEIRARVEALSGVTFNSVLINLYRTGRDYVAWHRDSEAEFGPEPIIASVSLGAVRTMAFRHRKRKDQPQIRLDLPNGSLLVMSGLIQECWMHQLVKTARPVGERINLTFRRVL